MCYIDPVLWLMLLTCSGSNLSLVGIPWNSRQSICVFSICLLRLSCSCDKCRGRGWLTALMFEVNWCAAFSNPDCRLWALFTTAGPANLWNTHLASWQIGNDGSTNPNIRKIWRYGGSDTIHSGHQTESPLIMNGLEFMLSYIDFRKYQASDSYIQDLSSSTKLSSV